MAKKQTMLAHIAAATQQKKLTDDDIKKQLVILDELRTFIPPLFGDEFTQLEENIISEGCRDPLVIWNDNGRYVLVDGHNRFSICTKNKIDFKIEIRTFEDLDEVKDWMINNQLGKRNMTEEQKAYFRGLQYKNIKKKESFKGNQYTSSGSGQNDHQQKSNEKLAEIHKVSPKTIQRDEKYADGIEKISKGNNELKWKILTRNIDIPKALVIEYAEKEDKEVETFRKQLLTGDVSKVTVKSNEQKTKENTRTESVAVLTTLDNIVKDIEKQLKNISKGKEMERSLAEIKNGVAQLEKEIQNKK